MYRFAPLLVLVLVCSLLAAPASGVVAPGVTNDVDPTPGPTATPAAALIGTPAGAGTGTTTMMDDAPADATDGPTAIERANRSLSVSTAKGSLEVHFVNVEEGIATLVVGPTGETMLVDSGGFGSEEHIQTYLGRQGVDRLDYLVASHAHGDHIAAHDSLVEHYETERNGVGVAYDSGLDRNTPVYRAYLDALAEHDVEHETLRRGDTVPLEGAEVTVLSPPEQALADGDFNENSLVLLVEFGDTSVLLTADAEDDAESFLVDADVPAVTVLQVSKEGSDVASTPAFLDRTNPVVAVVHGGDERDFDRPNRTVLARLAAREVPTYWTEVHGATVLESDGETMEVRAQSRATTEPLSLRDADSTLPDDTSPAERVGVIRDGVHRSTTDGNDGTATPPPTATPTPSPTASPIPSPTNSPTPSPTASLTPSPTDSPTLPPTGSLAPSPTPSPTDSPARSPTPGAPPTATPSPVTSSGEGSPTATPTTTSPSSRFVAPLDRFVRATGVPFSASLALFGIVAAAVLANRRR